MLWNGGVCGAGRAEVSTIRLLHWRKHVHYTLNEKYH
jgi:hypothetical protein